MLRLMCCGITFEAEDTYIEHRQQIHGEQPQLKHTCCGIKFYTDAGYYEHREEVHQEAKPAKPQGFWAKLFKKA